MSKNGSDDTKAPTDQSPPTSKGTVSSLRVRVSKTDLAGFAVGTAKIAILGVALFAVYQLYLWYENQDESYEKYSVNLLSVSEIEELITSYARVDILKYSKDDGDSFTWLHDDYFASRDSSQVQELPEIDSFCAYTYEVTFGYDSVANEASLVASSSTHVPALPKLLATNLIDAEDAGDALTECLKGVPDRELVPILKDAMVADGVFRKHMEHGHDALADHLTLASSLNCSGGDADCATEDVQQRIDNSRLLITYNQELYCNQESDDEALSKSCDRFRIEVDADALEVPALLEQRHANGAYVGTFMYTFSTIGFLANDHQVRLLKILPLWRNETFLVRREVAEVSFGVFLSASQIRQTLMPFSRPSIVITVPEPGLISMNRRLVFQGYKGDLERLQQGPGSVSGQINTKMMDALERAIASIQPYAQAQSRNLIKDRFGTGEVAVVFEEDAARRPFVFSDVTDALSD